MLAWLPVSFPLSADAQGEVWREPARKVEKVVDTTGAGGLAGSSWLVLCNVLLTLLVPHACAHPAAGRHLLTLAYQLNMKPHMRCAQLPSHPVSSSAATQATASRQPLRLQSWRASRTGRPCVLRLRPLRCAYRWRERCHPCPAGSRWVKALIWLLCFQLRMRERCIQVEGALPSMPSRQQGSCGSLSCIPPPINSTMHKLCSSMPASAHAG